jgi:hypothetical protein
VRSKGNWWLLLGLAAAAALVAAAVAGVAGAAVASSPKEKADLTGSSVWSTSYTVSGRLRRDLARGTYTGTLKPGSTVFSTQTCGPVCAGVTGSITVSTPSGRFTAVVQRGGVVSMEDIASRSFRDFTLALRVTGGTGRYARANGLLSLTYSSVWTHTVVDGVSVDRIDDTGTLVGVLR